MLSRIVVAVVAVAVATIAIVSLTLLGNAINSARMDVVEPRSPAVSERQQREAERLAALEEWRRQRPPARVLTDEEYAEREAERDVERRAERQAAARERASLELLDYSGTTGDSFARVEGRVRNISGRSLQNVQAVALWFTEDDRFITSEDALIDYNPVLAGQTSPFTVLSRGNPAMQRFRVEFKVLAGGTIPHVRAE